MDFIRQLKRKLRIKWRVLREKPRFLLGYVMDALFTWILGLAVAVISLVLFPVLVSFGFGVPSFSEMVSADKVGQIVGNVIEKVRQISVPGVIRFVREDIPADLRRLFVNLCDFVKRWREFLERFVNLLLAPRKLYKHLCKFWERHKAKIKIVATKALGIAISFFLFRLLMYFAPRLRMTVLTIWGVNAGVFILQWCITLVSPPIARKLRAILENLWATKKKQELQAAGETFIANVRETMDANRQSAKEPHC